jgi:alkaline phosphatase
MNKTKLLTLLFAAVGSASLAPIAPAATVTRLTPPSALFSFLDPNPPIIARFLQGQRFDVQATLQPDSGKQISSVLFTVDGIPLFWRPTSLTPADASGVLPGPVVATFRAYENFIPGVHTLRCIAVQNDGQRVIAEGDFEVVKFNFNRREKIKNVVFMIGDGMGIAHRTAARIVYRGVEFGKANAPLAMDTFPYVAAVKTASLNSIVTDSSPGASCYSTGNKNNNNQEGVFPDDTLAKFDNPRTEYLGAYLHRILGKSLGIVTTADVFDATPAAWAIHTQDRGAGTGICDQYLDEATRTAGLRVLMGGGRKWFLPKGTVGSARSASSDYVLPTELSSVWGVKNGAIDETRDLIADFQADGFYYAPDAAALNAIPNNARKLLGLFAFSNMNVAYDKISGRRGTSTLVNDYGFPDQPLLEEMTTAALDVLSKDRDGFVLMVEAASIDKQAHNMDAERWINETIEFDKAIEVAKNFADEHPGTLVVVTADHECAGVNIIGASLKTNAELQALAQQGGGAPALRDQTVGIYESASFPRYRLGQDGYPQTMDPDNKMLVGYAGNADRYEDWLSNPQPLQDSQQPLVGQPPLSTYPKGPLNRDTAGNYLVTGQVPGTTAVHTASDILLSAYGTGSQGFHGVIDNTDPFFIMAQGFIGGVEK